MCITYQLRQYHHHRRNPRKGRNPILPSGNLGHRSDVRTVCFSSDNTAVLSGSHESVKIWNRSARVCIRTVADAGDGGGGGVGYCLSSFFVAGDRQVMVIA